MEYSVLRNVEKGGGPRATCSCCQSSRPQRHCHFRPSRRRRAVLGKVPSARADNQAETPGAQPQARLTGPASDDGQRPQQLLALVAPSEPRRPAPTPIRTGQRLAPHSPPRPFLLFQATARLGADGRASFFLVLSSTTRTEARRLSLSVRLSRACNASTAPPALPSRAFCPGRGHVVIGKPGVS